MSLALSEVQVRLACHLNDTVHLVWSDALLEAAIRSALLAISRVAGTRFALAGLDDALETTLPVEDEHVLLVGAVAYALTFRATGRFEEAALGADLPAHLSSWASAHMARFQTLLAETKQRLIQTSTEPSFGTWTWEGDL